MEHPETATRFSVCLRLAMTFPAIDYASFLPSYKNQDPRPQHPLSLSSDLRPLICASQLSGFFPFAISYSVCEQSAFLSSATASVSYEISCYELFPEPSACFLPVADSQAPWAKNFLDQSTLIRAGRRGQHPNANTVTLDLLGDCSVQLAESKNSADTLQSNRFSSG